MEHKTANEIARLIQFLDFYKGQIPCIRIIVLALTKCNFKSDLYELTNYLNTRKIYEI